MINSKLKQVVVSYVSNRLVISPLIAGTSGKGVAGGKDFLFEWPLRGKNGLPISSASLGKGEKETFCPPEEKTTAPEQDG